MLCLVVDRSSFNRQKIRAFLCLEISFHWHRVISQRRLIERQDLRQMRTRRKRILSDAVCGDWSHVTCNATRSLKMRRLDETSLVPTFQYENCPSPTKICNALSVFHRHVPEFPHRRPFPPTSSPTIRLRGRRIRDTL